MSKARVLLVRLDRDRLEDVAGGVTVEVVVTHANIGVSVRDDAGVEVSFRRVELSGALDKLACTNS